MPRFYYQASTLTSAHSRQSTEAAAGRHVAVSVTERIGHGATLGMQTRMKQQFHERAVGLRSTIVQQLVASR